MEDNNNKTKTYSDRNKTSVYGDSEKRTKETIHNLKPEDKILLNNKEYKILEIISESTGEAVIYKVEDEEQIIYGLKLYFEFYQPENEPNTEALERIKRINDPDILQLFDFGTGTNKYAGKYCFEISDFAAGYDLLCIRNIKEKYYPEFIVNEVIPQIFKGILRLHANKIYHCDLKPQNVFYLDKEQLEIVIGDYGSAKTFDFDAEKKSRKTTTIKGTDFYLPPEQAKGFISEKNDYYSFGMILLHLLYPGEILVNEDEPKNLSHSKLKEIIERQFEAKPIIDFNPEYKRINNLIEGLTLVDFNKRWGKDELEKWLDGDDLEVIYTEEQKNKNPGESLKTILNFSGHIIKTPADLRDYILSEPSWYADLIEDTENRNDFSDWIIEYYNGDRSKRSAFNRIISHYSQEGIDFISDAIIRFFIPDHPVIMGLKSFQIATSENLISSTALAFHHLLFDLWDSSVDRDVRLYLFRYEQALSSNKHKSTVDRILSLLFRALSVDKAIDIKYENSVFAYTKTDKNSRDALKRFLTELTAIEIAVEFKSVDTDNNLYYEITKSASAYFKNLGIDINLILKSKEIQFVRLAVIESYDSLEDFMDKSFNYFLKDLFEEQYILNELNQESVIHLKTSFYTALEKIVGGIESELSLMKQNYSQALIEITGLCADISSIEDYIKHPDYNETGKIYVDIITLKEQLIKNEEAHKILYEFKNVVDEKSPAFPMLNEAEKLLNTKIYSNIEKASQILTGKHSFKVEAFFNIRDIENYVECAYQNLGKYTILKTNLNRDAGILALNVSNDGKYIIAASNISVTAYDTTQKAFVFTHKNMTNDLNRVAISNDNKYFAYTDIYHESAKVYDFLSASETCTLKKKNCVAYGISFSPDGKYLAVSGDETVFWNLKTRKAEKIFTASVEVSFLPEEAVFASMAKGKTLLTNYQTWKSTLIEKEPTKGNIGIKISPGGRFIAIANSNNFMRIIDVKTKKTIHHFSINFPDDGKPAFCFSPDEKLLVEYNVSSEVRFWNMETGKNIATINNFEYNRINGIAFHPGGEYVIIAYKNNLILLNIENSIVKGVRDLTIKELINFENKPLNEQLDDQEFEPLIQKIVTEDEEIDETNEIPQIIIQTEQDIDSDTLNNFIMGKLDLNTIKKFLKKKK